MAGNSAEGMTVMTVLGKNGKSSHTHTRGDFLYLAKTVITIIGLPFLGVPHAPEKAEAGLRISLSWKELICDLRRSSRN
jgi:hypothetical protein